MVAAAQHASAVCIFPRFCFRETRTRSSGVHRFTAPLRSNDRFRVDVRVGKVSAARAHLEQQIVRLPLGTEEQQPQVQCDVNGHCLGRCRLHSNVPERLGGKVGVAHAADVNCATQVVLTATAVVVILDTNYKPKRIMFRKQRSRC